MRKETDLVKPRATRQRRLRWLARQQGFRVSVSEQQLDLIRRWGAPDPAEGEERRLRHGRRAGVVSGAVTALLVLLMIGLAFLIWLHLASGGWLP